MAADVDSAIRRQDHEMLIQKRRGLLAGAAGLLVLGAARGQDAAPVLVLSNSSIGRLKLQKDTRLATSIETRLATKSGYLPAILRFATEAKAKIFMWR